MPDHKESDGNCFLISIEAVNRDSLYDCYRDYLVFMSLVRDGVRSCHYNVLGFCWLDEQCLMIIRPVAEELGNTILRLLKRYHFWLLQRGPAMTEFKFQMLEINQGSWLLDGIRFLHQWAVETKTVEDAMDYHWHSHHVYNGFWSLNWLSTDFVLDKFADSRLAAMNRYRLYMQHPHRLDFKNLLESQDSSTTYVSDNSFKQAADCNQAVGEINSQYHQSMLDRTHVNCLTKNDKQHIQIRVIDEYQFLDKVSE